MAANDKPTPTQSNLAPIAIAEQLNSSFITSSNLSGSKNYLPWSAAIKTFLMSKEKDKPEISSFIWAKEDAMVRSWLWNSMEPHVRCDVMLLLFGIQ